jgi:four helix bundle protein
MAYGSFEDLEVWRRSCDLAVEVHQATRGLRDCGFRDQICRSAVSIPSNIAEGMERDSARDRIHFLHIAKGSCAELRTQLLIAHRVGLMARPMAEDLREEGVSISRILHGIIKAQQKRTAASPKPKSQIPERKAQNLRPRS